LPGQDEARSFAYFGDVQSLLQNKPTELTNPNYNKISRGFFGELSLGENRYPGDPLVFVVREFNAGTDNEKLLDSSTASQPVGGSSDSNAAGPGLVVPAAGVESLGKDVAVLTGPGLATPSAATLQAARAAEQQQTEAILNHPSAFADPLHTLRVLFGLALLVI